MPLSDMLSRPVLAPAAVGKKVRVTTQLAPAAKLVPQVFVWLKSPLVWMLLIAAGPSPVFFSSTVLVVPVVFRVCVPKVIADGVKLIDAVNVLLVLVTVPPPPPPQPNMPNTNPAETIPATIRHRRTRSSRTIPPKARRDTRTRTYTNNQTKPDFSRSSASIVLTSASFIPTRKLLKTRNSKQICDFRQSRIFSNTGRNFSNRTHQLDLGLRGRTSCH